MIFREVKKIPHWQILFIKSISSSTKVLTWLQFFALITLSCSATNDFWNEPPESQRMPVTSAKVNKAVWIYFRLIKT